MPESSVDQCAAVPTGSLYTCPAPAAGSVTFGTPPKPRRYCLTHLAERETWGPTRRDRTEVGLGA